MRESDISTLIRTKIKIPRISDALIARPQLLERLNAGLSRKLTLISAPAGYGKTTLVAKWLQQIGHENAAWFSLDESDNDLSHFLGYVLAAIKTAFPAACPRTASYLQASQLPPVDSITTTLINEISSLSSKESFVLVLDDYHRLGAKSTVHQVMRNLIQYQPVGLHLALITRQDPVSLPLPQLRAGRDISELRQADLRFDLNETKDFIEQALAVKLPADTVAVLDNRLEGWVVGLHLASHSMRNLDDPRDIVQGLMGTDRFVMEYLVDEVLSHVPAAAQSLLLQTSILDRLCGSLCDAVTGVDDPSASGQDYLEWLESNNLFLIPLDHHREWYRYHHLFQDFLTSKLTNKYTPAEIQEMHARASQWFADNGYVEEAIQQALTGNRVDLALHIVESRSQNLLNQYARITLERWLSLLPKDVVWQRPKLLIVRAWMLYRQWRQAALSLVLDQAETLLESDVNELSDAEKQHIEAHILTLRSSTALQVEEDFQRSIIAGQQALRQLPADERGARGVAQFMSALSLQALGHGESAKIQMMQEIEDARPSSPAKVQLFVGFSWLNYVTADLLQMRQTTDRFLRFANAEEGYNALPAANYLAGILYYEWNELRTASSHFETAIEWRYRAQFVAGFNSGLGLVKIRQLRGEFEQAQELIDHLRQDTLNIGHTDLLAGLEAAQAEQWLLLGDVVAAERWARSFQTDVTPDKLFRYRLPLLTKTRILVQHGTDDEARELKQRLEADLVDFKAHHLPLRTIQTLVHLSLVYGRLAQSTDALTALRQAVAMAQPAGMIRTFVDCGHELVPLLQKLKQEDIASNYLLQLIAAFKSAEKHRTRAMAHSSMSIEPLTRREKEVIRLIEAGLTNQEIADELVISLFTVKKHSSNIFNKLAVKNRRQAVIKANQLGLLP